MAGTGLNGPHPTIANLKVILTDSTASDPSLVLMGVMTGTLNTTANTYQKGCVLFVTDESAAESGIYTNVGTSASPVWTQVSAQGIANGSPLFILDTGGASGNIVLTSYAVGTTATPLVTGLTVGFRLANALTAYQAATVNFNGTTKNLRAATDPTKTLGTAVAAGGVIWAVYTNGQAGGVWQANVR